MISNRSYLFHVFCVWSRALWWTIDTLLWTAQRENMIDCTYVSHELYHGAIYEKKDNDTCHAWLYTFIKPKSGTASSEINGERLRKFRDSQFSKEHVPVGWGGTPRVFWVWDRLLRSSFPAWSLFIRTKMPDWYLTTTPYSFINSLRLYFGENNKEEQVMVLNYNQVIPRDIVSRSCSHGRV